MRTAFEEAFRIGFPLLLVLGLLWMLVELGIESRRHRRVRVARMLAVTGPLVDEESATSLAARERIWKAKRAGKWPTMRWGRA
jgi:hypothetical protein